jgi:hypothetical protein
MHTGFKWAKLTGFNKGIYCWLSAVCCLLSAGCWLLAAIC